jgi:hypothetical protein
VPDRIRSDGQGGGDGHCLICRLDGENLMIRLGV